ncbi:MAG: hypothetical protein AB1540_00355 [Bdellovibrionota bacterium]
MSGDVASDEDGTIYKKYIYPDGHILSLTKEEFDAVVEVFKILDSAQNKLSKKSIPPTALRRD